MPVGLKRFRHAPVVITLVAVLALLMAVSPGPAAPALGPATRALTDPTARAQAALAAMQSAYYLGGAATFAPTPGDARNANLWGDSWALAALADVAALPGGSRDVPAVRAAADGLQSYWDAAARPPAYAPTRNAGATTVKYFDDNAWVGLDLVAAWRLTGDATYLQRAQAVMRYAASGWDPAGGGLWWSDQHDYRDTAANAATAELAGQLYLTTHNASDLAWAERIYAWERQTLVTPAGRVADGVPAGIAAPPQDDQWTYNYGSVVAAAVVLYQATGRPAYLGDARSVAAYALAHLRHPDGAWQPPARFTGVLADGLLLLWRQDRSPDLAAALARSADLAWTQDQTGYGLFGDSLSGPPPFGWVPLLTDTGAVRILAAAAAATTAPPR